MAEPIDSTVAFHYRRFARKYALALSCRPVGWHELPAHLRSPAPGPQYFIAMLARSVHGGPIALQWVVEQLYSSRARTPISFPVALADLQQDVLALRTLKRDGVIDPPEDFTELARLEAGLYRLLGWDGAEEFLAIA